MSLDIPMFSLHAQKPVNYNLTKYKNWKLRRELAASVVWIVEYIDEAMPCALCPPSHRLVTLTTVRGTMTSSRSEAYPICYKCIGKVHLKRDREHKQRLAQVYGIRDTTLR